MDELAKKLSMISFGIIGIICILGVIQHRSWLDMFTIGGGFDVVSLRIRTWLSIDVGAGEVQCRLLSQLFQKVSPS